MSAWGRLGRDRPVRLLWAEAAEPEARVLAHPDEPGWTEIDGLTADVALIAGLLAHHVEDQP